MKSSKTAGLFNTKRKVTFFSGYTTFQTLIQSILAVRRIMLVVVPKTLYIST